MNSNASRQSLNYDSSIDRSIACLRSRSSFTIVARSTISKSNGCLIVSVTRKAHLLLRVHSQSCRPRGHPRLGSIRSPTHQPRCCCCDYPLRHRRKNQYLMGRRMAERHPRYLLQQQTVLLQQTRCSQNFRCWNLPHRQPRPNSTDHSLRLLPQKRYRTSFFHFQTRPEDDGPLSWPQALAPHCMREHIL